MKKTIFLLLTLLLCVTVLTASAVCSCTAKTCSCNKCRVCDKYTCNCINEKACVCTLCRLQSNRCTCNLDPAQDTGNPADDPTVINLGDITHMVGSKDASWDDLSQSESACETLCPQSMAYFSSLDGFSLKGIVLAKDPNHRYLVIFGDEETANKKITLSDEVISEAEALGADRIALVHHETLRYLSTDAAKKNKTANILTGTLGYTNNLDILSADEINAAYTGK